MTTGLEDVLKNLNVEIAKIEKASGAGLWEAGIFIQGESMEMTPVDQAVLMNSAFTNPPKEEGSRINVTVGYTAKYAAWVHEMPGTLKGQPRAHFGKTGNTSAVGPQRVVEFGGGSLGGRYWDGGEPKFLQKAVSENHAAILKIIQKRAMIK